MIEFEAKIKGIAVPIPKNIQSYGLGVAILNKKGHGNYLTYCTTEMPWHEVRIRLPVGDITEFEIIGLTSEILKSEELAKKVVESHCTHWYVEYTGETDVLDLATDSFQSLLDKYNIVGEYLIIQKKDEK